MRYGLGLVLSVCMEALALAAYAQDGTTFYNFHGLNGTSQQFGNIEFYNFSNGHSATRQQFGNTDSYSSSTPGLSGTVQTYGNHSYGTWDNGTRSTHERYGNIQFDTYQRGDKTIQCTSQLIGSQTFTDCQ